jgi:hypothetical protein
MSSVLQEQPTQQRQVLQGMVRGLLGTALLKKRASYGATGCKQAGSRCKEPW